MEYITHSPQETIELAQRLAGGLKGGEIIAYRGDLGAGKTTMTRGFAIGLGLGDEVSSPTFALVNEYTGGTKGIDLYHFDMYRISGEQDLETTGFYDYQSDSSVLIIEWSENIAFAFDENTIYITLERIDDDTRKITVEGLKEGIENENTGD